MSTAPKEILVGSIGTTYDVPIFDDDLQLENFDPSGATATMFFRMPGAPTLLERTATPIQKTIDGALVWCLRYVVTAADVAPYASPTVGGFHRVVGAVAIEGYLDFSPSQKFPSSAVRIDQQGRPLKVVARLSV
jgi:hypothetical protein